MARMNVLVMCKTHEDEASMQLMQMEKGLHINQCMGN